MIPMVTLLSKNEGKKVMLSINLLMEVMKKSMVKKINNFINSFTLQSNVIYQ